jgi:hypothetical protein
MIIILFYIFVFISIITRCNFVASGLGIQKVLKGVFCRNVLIFRYFFDNLIVFGYLDNLVRKFASVKLLQKS